MKNPERYLVVEVSTGRVVAEADRFLVACRQQRDLQHATSRPYRIDMAGHRRLTAFRH